MTFHYHLTNHLEELKAQIEGLPDEFAALRDQLAPPKYRAEVQRILMTLDNQVTDQEGRGRDVEELKTMLTAIRAGQE